MERSRPLCRHDPRAPGRFLLSEGLTAAVSPGGRQVQLEHILVRGGEAGGNSQNGIVLSKFGTDLVVSFLVDAPGFRRCWRGLVGNWTALGKGMAF